VPYQPLPKPVLWGEPFLTIGSQNHWGSSPERDNISFFHGAVVERTNVRFQIKMRKIKFSLLATPPPSPQYSNFYLKDPFKVVLANNDFSFVFLMNGIEQDRFVSIMW
jgi:hypothetical protein